MSETGKIGSTEKIINRIKSAGFLFPCMINIILEVLRELKNELIEG